MRVARAWPPREAMFSLALKLYIADGEERKTPTRILEEPAQPPFLPSVNSYRLFLLQVHGRTHFLNSSAPPEIAIRAPMNNDRSSGGSSDGTTPPPPAGNEHEVDQPPPSPIFGSHLDAEVSIDGEHGPSTSSAGIDGPFGGRRRPPPASEATGFTTGSSTLNPYLGRASSAPSFLPSANSYRLFLLHFYEGKENRTGWVGTAAQAHLKLFGPFK